MMPQCYRSLGSAKKCILHELQILLTLAILCPKIGKHHDRLQFALAIRHGDSVDFDVLKRKYESSQVVNVAASYPIMKF